MDAPQYTPEELRVMSLMAHGRTRESVALTMNISQSTVSRTARIAADKAGGSTIVHGVAIMVAQGMVSVRFGTEKSTAQQTAEHWLIAKMMSCVDWREFEELRNAYRLLTTQVKAASREFEELRGAYGLLSTQVQANAASHGMTREDHSRG